MEIGRSLFNLNKTKETTLDECLKLFEPTPFWSSLPCREQELETIQEFITRSFNSPTPKTLIISGAPMTGKTSAVQLSAMMSFYQNNISFFNIEQWEADPESFLAPDRSRKLIIIDTPPKELLNGLVEFFISNNCSIILIIDNLSLTCDISNYITNMINFSSYDLESILIILNDKIRCYNDAFDINAIKQIASTTWRMRLGIEGAMEILKNSILIAKTEGKTKVDVNCCKSAINELMTADQ